MLYELLYMLSKLRVGIICGGRSLEHAVSLRSAWFIEQSIDKDRFETLIFWVNQKGNWYIINKKDLYLLMDDQYSQTVLEQIRQNFNQFSFDFDSLLRLDVVFPIIHGNLGEDGSLQGFLRIIDVPYVGSDVLGSAVCINKDITKHVLRSSGLPVIPFKTFLFNEKSEIDFYDLVNDFGLPLFVKPSNQGSSIGGSKVNNIHDFRSALNIAFACSIKIIIEPFIVGRELECAVLGNTNPQTSLCGEIILTDNDFYTYNDKYVRYNSKIVIPAVIDADSQDVIRKIAVQAFQILCCFGMARVDFFLTKDNQIFINEVNTLPGFTKASMYPKLWEATGLTTTALLTTLIELALSRDYKNL